jgi:hypothetical protein
VEQSLRWPGSPEGLEAAPERDPDLERDPALEGDPDLERGPHLNREKREL